MDLVFLIIQIKCSSQNLTIKKPENLWKVNKIQLIDIINIDCQICILDQLDLQSLVNIAATNKHFHNLAIGVFNRKYGQQLLEIGCLYPEKLLVLKDAVVINQDLVPQFLKVFSQLIKKLRIKYNLVPSNQQRRIGMLVNRFCSETIVEFSLAACNEGVFNTMTKPFKNVKTVAISGSLKNLGASELSFRSA